MYTHWADSLGRKKAHDKKKGCYKMKKWKKAMALISAMIMVLGLVACGPGSPSSPSGSSSPGSSGTTENNTPEASVYTIKLAHALAATSPYQVGAEKFKELVEEGSNGRIKVEIYPNGQLGAERDLFEGVQIGTVEMAIGGMSVLSQAYDPKMQVLMMPFLFESRDTLYPILDGEIGTEIFKSVEQNGIEVLGCYEAGFRQISNSVRPINTVEDVAGLKIRTPESQFYKDIWNELKASPTPIAWTEVFSALQTHVVDGAEVPISNFYATNFGEVQPYYAWINYTYEPIPIVISTSFMEKLPTELQELIRNAAIESRDIERQNVIDNEAAQQQELEDNYGVVFTEPELKGFQTAVQSIYDNYEYPDLLKKVQDAIDAL